MNVLVNVNVNEPRDRSAQYFSKGHGPLTQEELQRYLFGYVYVGMSVNNYGGRARYSKASLRFVRLRRKGPRARRRNDDNGADRLRIDLKSERFTGATQRLGFSERVGDEILKGVEVVALPFNEAGIERATPP